MAMTINSSPVLRGEYARAFVEEAERNGKLPMSASQLCFGVAFCCFLLFKPPSQVACLPKPLLHSSVFRFLFLIL